MAVSYTHLDVYKRQEWGRAFDYRPARQSDRYRGPNRYLLRDSGRNDAVHLSVAKGHDRDLGCNLRQLYHRPDQMCIRDRFSTGYPRA